MAKKKKRSSITARAESPVAAVTADGSLTDGRIWLFVAAAGALLLFVTFALVPWVTVLGANRTAAGLLKEALEKGHIYVAGSLLFVLLPGVVALLAPFLPKPLFRDAAATLTVVCGGTAILVINILTKSTRNLLAFGAGRQQIHPDNPIAFLYLSIGLIMSGSLVYLLRRDREVEPGRDDLVWLGAFAGMLLVAMMFTYKVLPVSLIPPPDFVRQRLGW
jgi:hypothetical protein